MCRLKMKNYIRELRKKYNHTNTKKPQLLLHEHREMDYFANNQYTPNANDSTKLNEKVIKRVQGIVGTLFYYTRAVNTKILVSLR